MWNVGKKCNYILFFSSKWMVLSHFQLGKFSFILRSFLKVSCRLCCCLPYSFPLHYFPFQPLLDIHSEYPQNHSPLQSTIWPSSCCTSFMLWVSYFKRRTTSWTQGLRQLPIFLQHKYKCNNALRNTLVHRPNRCVNTHILSSLHH